MAWYAQVKNNVVADVMYLVDTKDSDWLYREYGGTWLRCSESGDIRGVFPAVGFTYNAQTDTFQSPQPYPSWTYNQTTHAWSAPAPYPDDGLKHKWNENTLAWEQV